MSTTNGTMKSFKVTDKDGNVYVMIPVDTEARQSIDEAKNLQFDEDYFTSEVSQDQKTVNVGLNGVPLGVDSDSPLKFVQDNAQGIVLGSDAPFATAIAPEYSASGTYAVGDAVMHNGLRYECNTAISTAEAWTAAHWTETSVEEQFTNLSEKLLITLKPLQKYSSNFVSFGNNSKKIGSTIYSSVWMETSSGFTPTYSSSDPAGTSAWPAIFESDEIIDAEDQTGFDFIGVAENNIIQRFSYEVKNGHLYLLVAGNMNAGWTNALSISFLV